MSNIPLARELLSSAIREHDWFKVDKALSHMTRRKPAFIAPRKLKPLTRDQRVMASKMRAEGQSLNTIAVNLGTNIGRISETLS